MTDLRRFASESGRQGKYGADALSSARFRVLISLVLFFVVVNSTSAHPILVPRPVLTLADRLLLSDSVVLAREDPERPYHYVAVQVLKGESGTTPIDLLMTSQVRLKLQSDPDLAVLLRRKPKNAEWEILGIADDDYLQFIERILGFSDTWVPKETDNPLRLQEFASLLGHQDIRLHELAYLEIGRASYSSIRTVGADVSLERVRAMIDDPLYFEWRGLDIMLLGLSDDQRDKDRVINEMQERQSRSRGLNLAAWATAYLEIAGTGGIDQLTQWYFRDERRSRDELRSIARALAGHANYDPEWRQPVVAAFSIMLDTHPFAAPDIAHDLIAWKRWDLSGQLEQLRPQLAESDPLGVYKVNLYLQKAKMHTRFKKH